MDSLREQSVTCPYCGEPLSVLVDPSVDHQDYIEDCQVCCRPIRFVVTIDMAEQVDIQVFHEDE